MIKTTIRHHQIQLQLILRHLLVINCIKKVFIVIDKIFIRFRLHRLLNTTNMIAQQQPQSNRHRMAKSTSSLSFSTQSSQSLMSSSAGEMSPNSIDLNEIAVIDHSMESIRKLSHHHKNNSIIIDDPSNFSSRRRRKRTIFSAADIEHLKEAFIENPKPSRKYRYMSLK